MTNIATLRPILDGTKPPNTGEFRTAQGAVWDFVTALLGTDSTNAAAARALLGALDAAGVTTLTNKTFDTGGAGNVLKIAGTQLSAIQGTGSTVPLVTSGTWTPTGIGQTFASAAGTWRRVGNLVFVTATMQWSGNGAGNQAGFNGLPFTGNGVGGGWATGLCDYSASVPIFYMTATGCLIFNYGSSAMLDSTMSNIRVYLSGVYSI